MLVAIFLAILFFGVRSPNFHPFTLVLPAATAFNLNILAKMGFGALGGFEYVAILAGECRNPVQLDPAVRADFRPDCRRRCSFSAPRRCWRWCRSIRSI